MSDAVQVLSKLLAISLKETMDMPESKNDRISLTPEVQTEICEKIANDIGDRSFRCISATCSESEETFFILSKHEYQRLLDCESFVTNFPAQDVLLNRKHALSISRMEAEKKKKSELLAEAGSSLRVDNVKEESA